MFFDVLLFSQSIHAQAPEKLSYQAVIRNSSNTLVVNQPVGMKVSILQGSATGTLIYAETQTPTTNANGLINIAIGTGNAIYCTFSCIDWSQGPYFIKTEIDPSGGTAYTITSVSELLSVPYALFAGKSGLLTLPYTGLAENSNPGISVFNLGGTAISGTSDKPDSGIGISGSATSQTGSAVGVEGRVSSSMGYGVVGYATSTSGSAKGVYGISNALDGIGVLGESKYIGVRGVNLSTTGYAYGVEGQVNSSDGIAVLGSSISQTGNTVGVYGSSLSSTGKGVYGENKSIGGFNYGVYGFSASSSGTGVYGESYRCGVRGNNNVNTGTAYGVQGNVHSSSGIAVEGTAVSMTGYTVGVYGTSASPNGTGLSGFCSSQTGETKGVVGYINSPDGFSGYFAGGKFHVRGKVGISTESPEYDLDINKQTGFAGLRLKSNDDGVLMTLDQVNDDNNGHYSFIMFRKAGVNLFTVGAAYNEFRIFNANDKGLLVKSTGDLNLTDNLILNSGKRLGIGINTPGAGLHLKGTGYPDAFIFLEAAAGNDAGFRIYEGLTAKWHIFNDFNAGGLRIYNTNAATAIFCKQSNSYVGINTTSPTYNLEVNGTAGKTGGGSWSTSSDIRLKDITGNYTKGLKEIIALQPVSFIYKAGNARNLPTNVLQIGFVAQDVQKIFPEAVTKGEDGYLDFNIHAINVALVNAVKELQTENERLKTENDQLKMIIEKNDVRLTEVENLVRDLIKK